MDNKLRRKAKAAVYGLPRFPTVDQLIDAFVAFAQGEAKGSNWQKLIADTFKCGHMKVPSNIFFNAGFQRCRTCHNERGRIYRENARVNNASRHERLRGDERKGNGNE